MFVVIEVSDGLLDNVRVFKGRTTALTAGILAWRYSHPPDEECEMKDDPDYDESWGGVVRGFVMHWFAADEDVWVQEVD